MSARRLSREQARRFMLAKQGLWGPRRFRGERGVAEYVRSAGSVQFDPIDVCGRSAEIALNSRVEGFQKPMLAGALYQRRELIDYFDKNLCIMPVEDWPCFERVRAAHRAWERSHAEIEGVRGRVRELIEERGPLCSADLDMPQKVSWYWSDTRLSRAALEHMYFTGELAVHHKRGSVKYYDLAERLIPREILLRPDPYPDEQEHLKWRALRRIGAVGLMWERASDAWLCMEGFKGPERARVFAGLCAEGRLIPLEVEGIRAPLYLRAEDEPLLAECAQEADARVELLAPLDCMLWDRRLIAALFGFDYKWEIYTPVAQRRYGYYVLPLLSGARFLGRAELVCDRPNAVLNVRRIWYEEGAAPTGEEARALEECLERFARFNECGRIDWGDAGLAKG